MRPPPTSFAKLHGVGEAGSRDRGGMKPGLVAEGRDRVCARGRANPGLVAGFDGNPRFVPPRVPRRALPTRGYAKLLPHGQPKCRGQ